MPTPRMHLAHPLLEGAVCGLYEARETRDPSKVTCQACIACTLHMAAAAGEQRRNSQRLSTGKRTEHPDDNHDT